MGETAASDHKHDEKAEEVEKVNKKEKKEKHEDGDHQEKGDQEKTKDKKKKDKDGKCKEDKAEGKEKKKKNPEDMKDPSKLRLKLEKIDSKMQVLVAKKEEILKLLKEAEQGAPAPNASGGGACPTTTS